MRTAGDHSGPAPEGQRACGTVMPRSVRREPIYSHPLAMTDRTAQAWGAAILAAGGLLGIAAALSAGRPGALWRPLVIGSVAYAGSAGLVLHWGRAVYGARGALAALTLAAFSPPVLAALGAPARLAPAGGTTLAGGL